LIGKLIGELIGELIEELIEEVIGSLDEARAAARSCKSRLNFPITKSRILQSPNYHSITRLPDYPIIQLPNPFDAHQSM
jgi:hypothetical protein